MFYENKEKRFGIITGQKMKFSTESSFNICDQIRSFTFTEENLKGYLR